VTHMPGAANAVSKLSVDERCAAEGWCARFKEKYPVRPQDCSARRSVPTPNHHTASLQPLRVCRTVARHAGSTPACAVSTPHDRIPRHMIAKSSAQRDLM
jgi:hypothetical protein